MATATAAAKRIRVRMQDVSRVIHSRDFVIEIPEGCDVDVAMEDIADDPSMFFAGHHTCNFTELGVQVVSIVDGPEEIEDDDEGAQILGFDEVS